MAIVIVMPIAISYTKSRCIDCRERTPGESAIWMRIGELRRSFVADEEKGTSARWKRKEETAYGHVLK